MAGNGGAFVRLGVHRQASSNRIGAVFHNMHTHSPVPGCDSHALATVVDGEVNAFAVARERNCDFLWLPVLHRISHGFLRDAVEI